jgi:hypothetical protein
MKAIFLAVLLAGLGVLPARPESEYVCKPLLAPSVGQLGCSVNLHGGSLVVGANLDGGGSITPCHPSGVSWSCDPKIRASDGRTGDEFGRSAWIDGHWLAVGAPFADSPRAGGAGVVYLFRRETEASPWTETQKIFASDGARGDQLGLTVALSGDTLIVGAPNAVGNAGSLAGTVYVFHLDNGTWTQKQTLAAGDARPFDNFGFSLAIDGNIVVIGAPFHDGAGGNSGAAYVLMEREYLEPDGADDGERCRDG